MMKKLTSGLFAAALVMALPLTVDAQEAAVPADEVEVCTATIAPIHTSEFVAVTAAFDAPFGQVVGIETPAESGLLLVDEKLTEMAVEGELEGEIKGEVEGEIEGEFEGEIKPTPLADENANVSTFWLNSADAAPGTYLVTLSNETGESCTAEITVEEKIEKVEKVDRSESDEWTEAETDDTEDEDGEEY